MLERDATQHPFLWPLTLVLLLSHEVSYLPLMLPCCNTWISCLLVFFTLLCEGELFCYLVYYNFCDGNKFFCFNVSLKSGKILHEHLHNLFLDVEGLADFRNLVVWLVTCLCLIPLSSWTTLMKTVLPLIDLCIVLCLTWGTNHLWNTTLYYF